MVDQGMRQSSRLQEQTQNRGSSGQSSEMDQFNQISSDLVNYLTDYAKENPGYAALWCLGIGFVLGWKLKPW